jgi:hypothetical protein
MNRTVFRARLSDQFVELADVGEHRRGVVDRASAEVLEDDVVPRAAVGDGFAGGALFPVPLERLPATDGRDGEDVALALRVDHRGERRRDAAVIERVVVSYEQHAQRRQLRRGRRGRFRN